MQDKFKNIIIALAGIIQAIHCIRDIAQKGKTDPTLFDTSIQSIFTRDANHTAAVFGDIENIRVGLEKLVTLLSSANENSRLSARYMLSIMGLQKKISRTPSLVTMLTQRIEQTQKQVEYFSLTHPLVISNLSDVYLNIIAPFRFRFYIVGNQQILNVQENMEKIRALLLAAVRASVLWRQVGGSRLHFIFNRHTMKNMAAQLLKEMDRKV